MGRRRGHRRCPVRSPWISGSFQEPSLKMRACPFSTGIPGACGGVRILGQRVDGLAESMLGLEAIAQAIVFQTLCFAFSVRSVHSLHHSRGIAPVSQSIVAFEASSAPRALVEEVRQEPDHPGA